MKVRYKENLVIFFDIFFGLILLFCSSLAYFFGFPINTKTLPYYLGLLSSQAGINAAGVSAASSLILFIPNLVIFIVMQSKVMNTMARSGIK